MILGIGLPNKVITTAQPGIFRLRQTFLRRTIHTGNPKESGLHRMVMLNPTLAISLQSVNVYIQR